jgi:hypothetical protein
MEKYVMKETGREVKVGDVLTITLESPIGEVSADIIVTIEVLKKLVDRGYAYKQPSKNLNYPYLVEHLAKRIGWKCNNVDKYLDGLYEMCPRAVLNTLLLESALILDEKYEDHISKSDKFFILAYNKDGNMMVAGFPTFVKTIPMFRNVEDATTALDTMKELLPEICYNGE